MMTLVYPLLKCGENCCFSLALSKPLFSQKMALASHLGLLFNSQRVRGGNRRKDEGKQNNVKTDTWNPTKDEPTAQAGGRN